MKLRALFLVAGFQRAAGGMIRPGRRALTPSPVPAAPADDARRVPARRKVRLALEEALGVRVKEWRMFGPTGDTWPDNMLRQVGPVVEAARVAVVFSDCVNGVHRRYVESRIEAVKAEGWTPLVISEREAHDPAALRRFVLAASLLVAGRGREASLALASPEGEAATLGAALTWRGARGREEVMREALALYGERFDAEGLAFADPDRRPGSTAPGWRIALVRREARVAVVYDTGTRNTGQSVRCVEAAGWTAVVLYEGDVSDPEARACAALRIALKIRERAGHREAA